MLPTLIILLSRSCAVQVSHKSSNGPVNGDTVVVNVGVHRAPLGSTTELLRLTSFPILSMVFLGVVAS